MLISDDEGLGQRTGVAAQGDLGSLDQATGVELEKLSRQLRGGNSFTAKGPFIWGSIRVFAVYGKWSFWRNPKRKPT